MTEVARAAPRRRLETADDAAFRARLFRETHGAMLAGIDPALAETLLRQQQAGQAMTYAARHPAARAEIVECDGAAVGRLVTDGSDDGLTLLDIALLAASRGRGLGTRLIEGLLREADASGLPVDLSVAHGNPARRLYERLGFVAEAASATHLRMRREARPPPRA